MKNDQANIHRILEAIKNHDEPSVQILGQIRQFVKVRAFRG